MPADNEPGAPVLNGPDPLYDARMARVAEIQAGEDTGDTLGSEAEPEATTEVSPSVEGAVSEEVTTPPDADTTTVDPATLSPAEFEAWRNTASHEEMREFLARPDVVRGTADYSRKSRGLAEDRRALDEVVKGMFSGATAPQTPSAAPQAVAQPQQPQQPQQDQQYVDPSIAPLYNAVQQLAESQAAMLQRLDAQTQEQQIAQGRASVQETLTDLAKEYPWWGAGDKASAERAVYELIDFSQRSNTPDLAVAFKAMHVDEIADERAKAAIKRSNAQLQRQANVPSTAPAGSAKSVQGGPPKDKRAFIADLAAELERK